MADIRRISKFYTDLAEQVLDEYKELSYIRQSNVSIMYLESDHEKKSKEKIVLGQCEKIQDKYKWGIPCDFTITLFNPNLAGLSMDQLKMVLFHELLHVGIKKDGTLFVRPHDLEDFKLVINKFGTDWAKNEMFEEAEEVPFYEQD